MSTNDIPVQQAPFPTAPKPPKTVYTLDGRDRIFSAVLLACTLFCVIAGLWGGCQAGFTVSFLPLFTVCSIYLGRRNARPGVYAGVCGVLAVCLTPVFLCTSGSFIRFLAMCLLAVLSVIWFSSLAGKRIFPGELGLVQRLARQIGRMFVRMPCSVSALFKSDDPRTKRVMKALLGAACAVPLLGVVTVLLIRSDAAFEGLMQHMFADVGQTFAQIVVALIVFPFLLAFGFSTRKDADTQPKPSVFKGLDTLFIAAFLSVPAICYLVYLFSQLAYFFSAFSGILPEGYAFSYAEYARRGFFELCRIAGINLCMLYAMLLLSKKMQEKLPVMLRALATFIDLFTLLLISTAAAKMILYIRQYGVTLKRLGTSAFMLFMAVVFLTLLLRLYLPKVRVLPVAVVTAAIIVAVLGIGNIYSFAAWYNYTAYENGTLPSVDTAYLQYLGDEGIPYLVKLTQCKDPGTRTQAYVQLCDAVASRYFGEYEFVDEKAQEETYFVPSEKICGKLTQTSIPRRRAYAALDALLAENPDFLREYENVERAYVDASDIWF
ncbi:MAG: DUF4173 domain-containing protein [Clostridia bacterium]|nr:DUF4173 domain-containing protein [Clostridia bacterium]